MLRGFILKNLHLLYIRKTLNHIMDNTPVEKVDIMSYAGRWFVIYALPATVDKSWRDTTETYVIHPDGYYAVFTTYRLPGDDGQKYVRSKLFVVRGTGNAEMKSQFVWPVRMDYWIIELAEDYSYAVVGHPKHKQLCILSRKPFLDEELATEVIERCRRKGYEIAKLVRQPHANAHAGKPSHQNSSWN